MHKICVFVRKINVILNEVKDLNTSTLCLQILRFAQNDKNRPISGLHYLGTDYTDYTEFIAICFRSLWLMR